MRIARLIFDRPSFLIDAPTGKSVKAGQRADGFEDISRKGHLMTRRIKWWAVIGIAMFIIGALLVIHYSLRIAALMGFAH
ncbi:hypothetical protein AC629_24580 [Bradyrhizobium sp. NAS80.1]|nr:hypothetical protein AC629_24580 [Bradyrhizobium sp. NAS80.1]